MVRILIGSIVGGLAQWIVGAIFWATPLSRIAFHVANDTANAGVQQALAQYLTPTGTGTYYVPWPDTSQGTILHGRGPVAMIHFNISGFPLMDSTSLVEGLILSIVSILLIGLALHAIGGRVQDFASRAKLVILFSVAAALYFTVGQPVFNYFMPWGYFLYLALSQVLGLIAGGLVLVRWFMPKDVAVSSETLH
ncbi:MAG: hypothetical protein JF628_14900 [Sphingomonas sp.]|nr:hypothetical protein [Sphingomonas sp.]